MGSAVRCALELDWARLLGERDPAEFTQFEYTLRPWRAATGVLFSTLFPHRFWRRVRIESPPAVHRLRRLRAFCGAVFALGAVSLFLVLSLTVTGRVSRESFEQAAGWLAPAVPPLVTAALMPVFTPTLSRFRIRRDQLLRVFAYGACGLVWLGWLYVAIATISIAALYLVPFLPATIAALVPQPFFPDLLGGLDWLTTDRTPWSSVRLWA